MSDSKKSELNVQADVTLMISVCTGGTPDDTKEISVEELLQDPDLFARIGAAIQSSEEVKYAMECLSMAAVRHRQKYPTTSIKISPAIAISEPQEIPNG